VSQPDDLRSFVKPIDSCRNCPCYSDCCFPHCGLEPKLDFEGYPQEDGVHPDCPLKNGAAVLHIKQPDKLVAVTIDWKVEF